MWVKRTMKHAERSDALAHAAEYRERRDVRNVEVTPRHGVFVMTWEERESYSHPNYPNFQGSRRKIVAHSFERYNGGVRIKRQYGSSTVTKFYIYYAGDEKDPSKWKIVEGYGPTPGDRKTDAIRRSGLLE